FDRSHRGRLRVHGRAPVQMLQGILTNSVPPAPVPEGEGLFRGRSAYSTLLTPKGRMVTDLTLCWCGAD
ncbi:MAG: hypothetical protein GWO24_36900, partial [Akkermansiaceae bacterium]|nr:hypothetical protein [Akkermansiaceae bacterium]NIW77629.1 hypothetical protein [Gemmatimonadota bacterium]